MTSSRNWLELLARLGPDDLRRISRLVDLLVVSSRASKEVADAMLDAGPHPATAEEARARCDAVCSFLSLEQRP